MPSRRRRAACSANCGSSDGSTTPLVSPRIRRRTSGITICGRCGASLAPAAISTRSTRLSDVGSPCSADDVGESTRSSAVRRNSQDLVGQPLHQFATGRDRPPIGRGAAVGGARGGSSWQAPHASSVSASAIACSTATESSLYPITGNHFIDRRVHHVQVLPNAPPSGRVHQTVSRGCRRLRGAYRTQVSRR